MAELSTKPYLIRAIHEWCADCGHTPYLAVVVDERTVVPRAYVKNGEIVLNMSMSATNRLTIGNELIEFQARFGGIAHELSIPVENVTAIYARETGHGMAFDVARAPAPKDEQRRDDRRPPKPVAVPSLRSRSPGQGRDAAPGGTQGGEGPGEDGAGGNGAAVGHGGASSGNGRGRRGNMRSVPTVPTVPAAEATPAAGSPDASGSSAALPASESGSASPSLSVGEQAIGQPQPPAPLPSEPPALDAKHGSPLQAPADDSHDQSESKVAASDPAEHSDGASVDAAATALPASRSDARGPTGQTGAASASGDDSTAALTGTIDPEGQDGPDGPPDLGDSAGPSGRPRRGGRPSLRRVK